MNKRETIIILDFGSQYSQLIARRIRDVNVFSKILPYNISIKNIKKENPIGIILSGGPASVLTENAPKCETGIFSLGIPVLGICYGLQLMVQTLNGKVSPSTAREYGRTKLYLKNKKKLFAEISQDSLTVWMSHGDKVDIIPEGFSTLASTNNTEFAAISNIEKKLYGIQFHPEVVHSEEGTAIIHNFTKNICNAKEEWTMSSYVDIAINEIRETVKDNM